MKTNTQFAYESNIKWRRVCQLLMVIFLIFMAIDLFFPSHSHASSVLKLSTIAILFFAQLAWGRQGQVLWKAAAGLTVVADFFLVFPGHYLLGGLVFNFVQVFRYLQITYEKGRGRSFLILGPVVLVFMVASFFFPSSSPWPLAMDWSLS